MIGKLFGGKGPVAAIPDGERVYAIGDVHGCDGLLAALLALIDKDGAGANSRLILLGDYVDRGPGSRAVIDLLLTLKAERPEPVFLKGNHEQAMLDFLEAPERGEEWLHWGGDKTLESYGVAGIWKRHPEDVARDLAAALPSSHREFLGALDLWTLCGDYAFVHAGFKPGVPLGDQTQDDCLWIRSEFHNAAPEARPDKVVVHGHHPVKKPLDAGWRIDVDTGAVWSDALTAVVLEGTTRRFISTGRF
ncbi:MAG: metallophosphoesterase family protein [Pseudomonadota bacterium]